MKILLDECVPRPFCRSLQEHECHDARRAGFSGKRNGELLSLAEANGFDVLLTVDKSIPYQQNLIGRSIALLILDVQSNKLSDLITARAVMFIRFALHQTRASRAAESAIFSVTFAS